MTLDKGFIWKGKRIMHGGDVVDAAYDIAMREDKDDAKAFLAEYSKICRPGMAEFNLRYGVPEFFRTRPLIREKIMAVFFPDDNKTVEAKND